MNQKSVQFGLILSLVCLSAWVTLGICTIQREGMLLSPTSPRTGATGTLKNVTATRESTGQFKIVANLTYNTTYLAGENGSFTLAVNAAILGGTYNSISFKYLQVLYGSYQFWGSNGTILLPPSTDIRFPLELPSFANSTPGQVVNVTFRVGFILGKTAGGSDFIQVASEANSEYQVEVKSPTPDSEQPHQEGIWIMFWEIPLELIPLFVVIVVVVVVGLIVVAKLYRKKHPKQRKARNSNGERNIEQNSESEVSS